MHHESSLITILAMGFVLAFAFGFVAIRLRLPPIVGYLVAGILIGPFTPGIVGDIALAAQIRLGPGDFFGEMGLLSGERRSADVTAVDYCDLLILDQKDFKQFVAKYPALRAQLDQMAAQRAAMNKQPSPAE